MSEQVVITLDSELAYAIGYNLVVNQLSSYMSGYLPKPDKKYEDITGYLANYLSDERHSIIKTEVYLSIPKEIANLFSLKEVEQ